MNDPKPHPKFIGTFTLTPTEAWEQYRDTLFARQVEDIPDHMDAALHLAFMVGLSHGAMLQGELARGCVEFVNNCIQEMFDPAKQ
jgi:hypothetical protein